MAFQEKDKEQLIAEAFDDKRVNFWCKKHNYLGPVSGQPEIKPAGGCADCWKIWYIIQLSKAPPGKRRQELEELEEVLHTMEQMITTGKWDFTPYDHAKIEIGTE